MGGLGKFFKATCIAVIGASRTPGKVGYVILENLIKGGFAGTLYPINPDAEYILQHKCYPSVKHTPQRPDLVIIATKPDIVPQVMQDCGERKIRSLIIVSAGFKEVGKPELEKEVAGLAKRYKMRVIGPNCLGVYDTHSKIDSLLLPSKKLRRPQQGNIAFISQSGAVGSVLMDMAAAEGFGFSKFISYGNAMDVTESDLIEYLANDKNTKVICAYIEGVKDGKRFLNVAKRVSRKKPLIILKAGTTEAGKHATLSHTGALAGSAEVYFGAFRQAGIITAETLQEFMDYIRIFEKMRTRPKGRRVQIITNGGGYGIIAADACYKEGLTLAKMRKHERAWLSKFVPPIAIIKNPIDLLGDATNKEYDKAIEACLRDPNTDILYVIVLLHTPQVDEPEICSAILHHTAKRKKPIVVVTTGSIIGEELIAELEKRGVPAFRFPENAARALRALVEFFGK